jgi:SSS family solute:Na+ symporter
VTSLRSIDLLVLLAYLGGTVGLGCWFALRKRNTDEFMAGGRSLPGWAVGLSMFGSYVSSISFLANPGKAFASNWNAFVFSIATPIAALVAVRWFVPFYRRSGDVSAYEHLEHRFGAWARTYAVACFLLTQMARTGTILFLLALAVNAMLGWDVRLVIVLTGAMMVLYTVFGGIQAAVWIGVVQALVLLAGPLVCLVMILMMMPGGAGAVVDAASQAGKFSLGGLGPSLAEPTLWVTLAMGLAINLGNFSVDQSYVQRYVTTPTEREAKQSVLITAALYVPVAAFFFFIGTALFVLRQARPELFAAAPADADKVFPYFIANLLPVGLGGLVVAGVFAAAMDSTLSSMATLTFNDVYKRYVRPDAGERQSMRVLSLSTVGWGVASVLVALAMLSSRKNVLDAWWQMASIFSGGMLGLFLLGLMARRAGNAAAAIAVAVGIVVILWMTLSPTDAWPASLAGLRSPLHSFLITVVGTLTILLVGVAVSSLGGRRPASPAFAVVMPAGATAAAAQPSPSSSSSSSPFNRPVVEEAPR